MLPVASKTRPLDLDHTFLSIKFCPLRETRPHASTSADRQNLVGATSCFSHRVIACRTACSAAARVCLFVSALLCAPTIRSPSSSLYRDSAPTTSLPLVNLTIVATRTSLSSSTILSSTLRGGFFPCLAMLAVCSFGATLLLNVIGDESELRLRTLSTEPCLRELCHEKNVVMLRHKLQGAPRRSGSKGDV